MNNLNDDNGTGCIGMYNESDSILPDVCWQLPSLTFPASTSALPLFKLIRRPGLLSFATGEIQTMQTSSHIWIPIPALFHKDDEKSSQPPFFSSPTISDLLERLPWLPRGLDYVSKKCSHTLFRCVALVSLWARFWIGAHLTFITAWKTAPFENCHCNSS